MEADICDMLSRGDINQTAYGEQTASKIHELTGEHWDEFFKSVRSVIEELMSSAKGFGETTVHLRAWASKLSRDGHYDRQRFQLSALHNHVPAFLSAIYYLRLSEQGKSTDDGTFFVNPFMHPLASPQPGVVIAPQEGSLVIFPSSIMHGPLRMSYAKTNAPRIIVAVDAHLVPR